MTSVLPRLLCAATAACVVLLAAACSPAQRGVYGPSLADVGPRTSLAPASWNAQSSAGEVAAWMRQGCRRPEGSRAACVERALTGLIDPAGIAKSMEVLDTLVATDEEVRRNAHALAHGLGISAYRSPETAAATFAGCTPSQMSGCYHGVIQGYFLAQVAQGKQTGTPEIDALCEPHRSSMFLFFQCAHGMGHGVMALHGHHVPMALETCDLATDDFIRGSCYGGVFMENIVNVTHPHHTAEGHAGTQGHAQHAAADPHAGHRAQSAHGHAGHQAGAADAHAGHGATRQAGMNHGEWKALDRNDFQYPCNAVAEKYKDSCYTMQTSAVLYFTQGNLGAVARACAAAPREYRDTCFGSLGRDITAVAAQNHQRSLEFCGLARGLAEGWGEMWCVAGVAVNFVNLAADPGEGIRFCRLVQDERGKTECYRSVGQSIASLENTTSGRAAQCERAEPAFVVTCRRGAGIQPAGTDD
ncbi:MAG: hypothetical protein KY444_10025 [Gemmatimonadetes bacterium]|nr:hypothetical protein [Gemmatimonadota bacterium]